MQAIKYEPRLPPCGPRVDRHEESFKNELTPPPPTLILFPPSSPSCSATRCVLRARSSPCAMRVYRSSHTKLEFPRSSSLLCNVQAPPRDQSWRGFARQPRFHMSYDGNTRSNASWEVAVTRSISKVADAGGVCHVRLLKFAYPSTGGSEKCFPSERRFASWVCQAM